MVGHNHHSCHVCNAFATDVSCHVCNALTTDVRYAHLKCSSCPARMIVMLDKVNPSFILCYACQVISGCGVQNVRHVMLLSRGGTCAHPMFKCGSFDDTLWTQCHDQSQPAEYPKKGEGLRCGLSVGKSTGTCLTLKTTPKYVVGESRRACHRCGLCFPKCLSYSIMDDCHAGHRCVHSRCRTSRLLPSKQDKVAQFAEKLTMVAPLYVLIDRKPSSGMKDPEVYRYNPTDLTKMMGERFQLHLCSGCVWESHHGTVSGSIRCGNWTTMPSAIHVYGGYQLGGRHKQPGLLRRRCGLVHL